VKKIRKQTILLVTTLIFALILCGAVTAADPQNTNTRQVNDSNGSGAAQDDSDPRIYGTVKEIYNESSGTYTNLNKAIPVKVLKSP